MKKNLPIIFGIIIVILLLLFKKGGFFESESGPITKIDTVIVYKHIVDTIPGEIVYVKTKIDTSKWILKEEHKPDTSYLGLLSQYKKLGNNHFSTNIYQTEFKIDTFGTVTVIDSIRANQLVFTSLVTDLKIPTTTVTIEKEAPKKRQLFAGGTTTINQTRLFPGVYGGLLYKSKKDQIFGVSLGFNKGPEIGGSFYIPLN
jgi:hypothetical protein